MIDGGLLRNFIVSFVSNVGEVDWLPCLID